MIRHSPLFRAGRRLLISTNKPQNERTLRNIYADFSSCVSDTLSDYLDMDSWISDEALPIGRSRAIQVFLSRMVSNTPRSKRWNMQAIMMYDAGLARLYVRVSNLSPKRENIPCKLSTDFKQTQFQLPRGNDTNAGLMRSSSGHHWKI